MWAQTWGNIYDIVVPFPGKTGPDVTAELDRQVSRIWKYSLKLNEWLTM